MHGGIPLVNKSGTTATQAFKTLIEKEKRKWNEAWSDRGKEFSNKILLDFS